MKLCKLAIWSGLALLTLHAAQTLSPLAKEAQKAENAGNTVLAYILYTQASVQNPSDAQLRAKAEALRPMAEKFAVLKGSTAAPGPKTAMPLDPAVLGTITEEDLREARRLQPPPVLKGSPQPKDIAVKGNSKELFEQVAKMYGLRVVFDSNYQPVNNLHLNLTAADYHDALRSLEAASGSFAVPISASLFLVANDTTQKRTEFDRTATVVLPVPEPFAVQDLQEIATAIRGVLDIQRLMVDGQRRMIVIRDRITKVQLARKLIQDLMAPRPQVAIEVELIEASETSSLHYGISLPSAFSLVWFGQSRTLTSSYPSGYTNYVGFGAGKSFVGLGVTNASLFANVSKSSSKTLLKSEVVTSDGVAAAFHVGDKYPIVTNGYFGTQTAGGQSYAPPPTFNFEDLGLILKVTPRVHGLEDVSLEVEAEFKLLGSTSVDGIPVISNRKFQSKVRLAQGEWAVLAGLMSDSDGRTVSGIPGLSLIPIFRNNQTTRSHGDTLVVLKPHLLNLPPTEKLTKEAWVGTESHPRSVF